MNLKHVPFYSKEEQCRKDFLSASNDHTVLKAGTCTHPLIDGQLLKEGLKESEFLL